MTSIAARFLPSNYMTPSSKPAESATSQQNSQTTKAPQDPISELKKYAASLTNQHRAGLFSAMAKTDASQATSSPSQSTSPTNSATPTTVTSALRSAAYT